MKSALIPALALACMPLIACAAEPPATPPVRTEVVVLGATPAGVMAAVAAARHGRSVALLEETNHVGGVVSGGLCSTDIGDRNTVGGLADEFFKRIDKFYRDKYGPDSRQVAQCRGGIKFEPHVAELHFEQMLKEQPAITVWKRHRLQSVAMDAGRITALTAEDLGQPGGRTFEAAVFVDATYTGDLLAAARVPYRVGREGRAEYGEYLAGINKGPRALRGCGDHRTQAYNYRVSITFRPENRVLFPKPEHYDPQPWRVTYGNRIQSRGIERFFDLFTSSDPIDKPCPNDKLDTNWCDLTGGSEGYAEGDAQTRAHIEARHRDFFLSLLYYLQNDPKLPEKFRADAHHWGLPRDEFPDNAHFPHQIYVREARRMLGCYVLREQDQTQDHFKPNGICAGSYGIDCHTVQWLLDDGKLVHEGNLLGAPVRPYDIPYACLTPREPANLLVPVCLSTTHVAYASLRMEPVYMMLGHAAGDAAHLAVTGKLAVQAVDVAKLRDLLRREKAVLDAGYEPQVRIAWSPQHARPGEAVKFHVAEGTLKDPLEKCWWDFEGTGRVSAEGRQAEHAFALEKLANVSLVVQDRAGRRRLVTAEVPVGRAAPRDVTVDESEAELFGRWMPYVADVFTGPCARRDWTRNGVKSAARARFQPTQPLSGRYQLCLGFRPAKGQASNVLLTIKHADGAAHATIDQRTDAGPFPFAPVGEFRFRAGDGGFIDVHNGGTDGHVVIDAVRWVWLGE